MIIFFSTGLRKVFDSLPFSKMVPVDVLFASLGDIYPDRNVRQHFQPRNLLALALQKPICRPIQHFTEISKFQGKSKIKNFFFSFFLINFYLLRAVE